MLYRQDQREYFPLVIPDILYLGSIRNDQKNVATERFEKNTLPIIACRVRRLKRQVRSLIICILFIFGRELL